MKKSNETKQKLHPRSFHNDLYNFDDLIKKVPDLKSFIIKNPNGLDTLTFANPQAVYLLNKALVLHFYNLNYWELPKGNLVPPVPGRADYIHYLADLISQSAIKNDITVLDLGTGANLIYPIIGSAVYDWNFVATDIEQKSLQHAAEIIAKNERLSHKISLRFQLNKKHILKGIVEPRDYFELVMCNPPFFKSKEEAETQTLRKLKGLNNKRQVELIHNFSGKNNELWCDGGELTFLLTLINESVLFKNQVGWFTSLVSNNDHLKPLEKELKKKGANYKVIQMAQGNKMSRILAWQF